MPTYDEWTEEAEYEKILDARFKELNTKFKEKGLRVKIYIKERTSRNALKEIINTQFYAQVDNIIKGKEPDFDVEVDDISLFLTPTGLVESVETRPFVRFFDTKEECRKALLPALITYFITDEYHSAVSNANVFTLGDADE